MPIPFETIWSDGKYLKWSYNVFPQPDSIVDDDDDDDNDDDKHLHSKEPMWQELWIRWYSAVSADGGREGMPNDRWPGIPAKNYE